MNIFVAVNPGRHLTTTRCVLNIGGAAGMCQLAEVDHRKQAEYENYYFYRNYLLCTKFNFTEQF